MKNPILHVLEYFSIFSYPPTTTEVYSFLSIKKSEREFNMELNTLEKKGLIFRKKDRLTLHKDHFKIHSTRSKHSEVLLSKSLPYIHKLSIVPTIRFVGISGSLSMKNTSREGDIDLFIIASANTIWLTRFTVLVYKYIIMTIQSEVGSKMCFNMFFSEKGLQILPSKQNEYTGHEILQLRPVVDKNLIHKAFLYSNKWIIELFPQSKVESVRLDVYRRKPTLMLTIVESFFRTIQEWRLKKKGYRWKYENDQLWLIQDDFEKMVL